MTSAFIPEHEIYGLLSRVGIKTPRYCFVDDDSKVADAPFASGDPVVIKGMAQDLWHKSDNGALVFCDFDVDAVRTMHGDMSVRVGRQFDWLGTLIAEKVEIQSARNAPNEIFVSLQRDRCCGAIISFGFGGLLTENWARELQGIAKKLITPEIVDAVVDKVQRRKITNSKELRELRKILRDPIAKDHFLNAEGDVRSALLCIQPIEDSTNAKGRSLIADLNLLIKTLGRHSWRSIDDIRQDPAFADRIDQAQRMLSELKRFADQDKIVQETRDK